MKTAITLTIVATFATFAFAQENTLPDGLKKLDRNGDGKITREEMPKLFDQIDADKDGVASAAELTAYFSKARAAQPAATTTGEPTAAAPTLDDVEKRPVVIFSDGTRMAGDLYLPKNRKPEEKLPAIVLCAGTGGTKGGTQARVAPIFARNGYVVLAFDYRGWGESESQLMAVEPQPKPDEKNEMTLKVKALRWQMNATDQTEDIRAAISFVAGEPGVDKERIALWGSSYGGGLVTTMAALDPRVKCVAAQVPGMGGRSPRATTAALELHTKQARAETEPVPIETGKMTGKMEGYSNMRVNPAKSVGFSAVEAAERITSPIIFLVAENEELSSNANVEAVQKGLLARGVPSAYHVIKGITHYGIYREGFKEATDLELAWFDEHLKGAAAKRASAETPARPAPQAAPTAKPAAGAASPNIEQGFAALDADKDGKLSATEFAALKEAAKYFQEHPEHIEPAFKRLDADSDGALTLDEHRKISQPRPRKPAGDGARPKPEAAPAKPSAQTPAASAADIALSFEKSIRPVLVKNCYDCHSADAKELKAGFALDSRDALLKVGASGAAVVPGKPEESLLITSLRYTDLDLKMPPEKHGGKLADSVVADFAKWVKRGVPMPSEATVTMNEKMEARLVHWAFQQVKDSAVPAVKNAAWARTDVVRFVLAAVEAKGLAPVRDADPAMLLRRVHLDLTRLPPTAEQVSAYFAQPGTSRLEGVIDELMKSPEFGERWGRRWLNVARYAESNGKETDFAYPQAWRYRDYVIAAFNADKLFDQFIREQIAGGRVKAGHVHGATDEFGYESIEKLAHIHDWHAPNLHLLGLEHTKLTYRHAGRHMRLTEVKGNVVQELLA